MEDDAQQPQAPEQSPTQQDDVPSPQPTPQTNQPKKRPPVLLIILVGLLLIGAGFVAWKAFSEDAADTGPASGTSQPVDEANDTADHQSDRDQYKVSVFTSGLMIPSMVAVEHPADWEVLQDSTEYGQGTTLNRLVIGSNAGHYLHIYDVGGRGGACENNEIPYTLYKKIPTSTEGLYFTEYKGDDGSYRLKIEYLGKIQPDIAHHDKHILLQEGQSGTNTCNIAGPSHYLADFGIFDSPEAELMNVDRLGWDDIAEDEEFVKMLQSIVATDSVIID